jgi:hypothetical protein
MELFHFGISNMDLHIINKKLNKGKLKFLDSYIFKRRIYNEKDYNYFQRGNG